MSKYFRFLLLVILAFGLLAVPAFAGTTYVNVQASNTPYTAALEALGAATNVVLQGGGAINTPSTVAVSYTLGQTLTTSNLVQVVLNGASFTGDTINLCALNGGGDKNSTISSAVTTSNSTSQNFQISFNGGENIVAGNYIWATNTPCGIAGGNMPIRLPKSSIAGSANITISVITSGNIPVDNASTATVATIASEYSPALSSADTITIDYLGTPGNGTKFASAYAGAANNSTAGSVNKLTVTYKQMDLDATNALLAASNGGVTAAVAVNASVSVSDTASWAGVNRVYIAASNGAGATNCVNNQSAANNTSPSGTIALAIPVSGANGWAGSANLGVSVCIDTNATSSAPLVTRVINGTYAINIGTGGVQTITSPALAAFQNWGLNGYQGLLPWLTLSSGVPTTCVVNNANSLAASMFLSVLASDTASTVTGVSLGSIAGSTTLVLVFDNNGVSSINAAGTSSVLNSLSGVTFTGSSASRYAAQLTVAGAASGINMACAQTDPHTGGKRPVPVFTTGVGGGATATW